MTTVIRLTSIRPLKLQQLAFDVETASVTTERAARCDHAVARHDDGDWIPIVRHADGTVGMRVANGLSDVTVAAGLAVGNFEQRPPARKLELSSTKVERKGKLASLACKVFAELVKVGSEDRPRFLELNRLGIQILYASFKFEAHEPFWGSGEEKGTHRRRGADAK